jgi:class 3 adenylate cyclase
VLWNGSARSIADDDYPSGQTSEELAAIRDIIGRLWGTEEMARLTRPDSDEADLRFSAKWQRASLTSAAAVRRFDVQQHLDTRSVLPTIQAPTLVLHRTDNALIPVELRRYLAQHIPGARFVEVPGGNLQLYDESAVLDVIEEFLTGVPPAPPTDRVLATLLFTDFVGSTQLAETLGDRRWRQKLDAHDSIARELVDRFQGRLIQKTGDGVLATFDGPGKAVLCAHALRSSLQQFDIAIRAGIHTGEIELRRDDIGGLAVHIAARVMAAAHDSEVWCSRTVRDLVVGSGIEFDDCGIHSLKGVSDQWHLFAARQT